MTRGPQCRLIGGRKLRRELKAAGFDMANLRTMHLEVAKFVVQRARPRVPVGPTGRLKKSVKPAATRTRAELVGGRSPRLPYANPVHWGWPAHSIAPNPFLTTAAEQTEPQWLDIYLRHINTILEDCEGIPA